MPWYSRPEHPETAHPTGSPPSRAELRDDRIVQVRNYLPHFDETEKPAIVDDLESMYNLNQRFRALSIILLLKYLGVPEDKVTDGVTSHLKLAR
jgi:hypothetical protein